MMKRSIAIALIVVWALAIVSRAQTGTVQPPTGRKTLAATINVYVCPAKGQTSEQQSTDEAACYDLAVQNTGTDPFQIQEQSEAQKTRSA